MAAKRPFAHIEGKQLQSFPEALLKYRYSYRGDSRHQLQYAHRHVIGEPSPVLELSGWESIDDWLIRVQNKRWHGIRGININQRSDITIDFLENLSYTLMRLESVHAEDIAYLNELHFSSVLTKFTQLHTLSIAGCHQFEDDHLDNVLSELQHVRHLDISRCPKLTNKSLLSVTKHISDITVLIASHNPNFTVEGANELIMYCENMHKLDLSNCEALGFIGILISLHGMIQYGSWNIKDINLNNCTSLHIESLMWLEAANAHLHHVQLKGLKNLNDAVVAGIASGSENLRYLDIEGCRKVGAGAVLAIAANCRKNLTHLNIAKIGRDLDSTAVKQLLSNCSALTHLDLEGNKKIADAAFVDDAGSAHSSLVAGRPAQLVHLNVAGCLKISTYGVSVIAERNTMLVRFDVSGLKNLTDTALSVIGVCCGKTLLHFSANDCERLTDAGVAHIASHCKRLETLSLSSSVRFIDSWMHRVQQYSDSALESILLGLPRLHSLSMRNQCCITFSSPRLKVDFPSAGGHFCLSELDLKGADCLHQAGFSRVLSHCYNLSSVWLSDTKAMPWVKSSSFLHTTFRNAVYSSPLYVPSETKPTHEAHTSTRRISKLLPRQASSASLIGNNEAFSQASQSRKASVVSVASSIGSESIVSNSKQSIAQSSASSAGGSIMDASEIDNPRFVQVLIPVDNANFLQWRDKYIRRRLLELYASRVVQQQYRVYRFWKKIKRFVRARQIAQWYKNILEDRKYATRLQNYIKKRSVAIIYRAFKKSNLLIRARAAVVLQKMWRGVRSREFVRSVYQKIHAATMIQAQVRGMLYRLSDQYILAQLYLRLPPFWQTVLNAAPASKYFDHRHIGLEISKERQLTQNILGHIIEDLAENYKLAPKLPFIIPQTFDKKPYVSLTDGRKVDIFSDVKGLLNTDGMRGAAAAAARRQALQHGQINKIVSKNGKKRRPGTKGWYKAVFGNPTRPQSPKKITNSRIESSLTARLSTARSSTAQSSASVRTTSSTLNGSGSPSRSDMDAALVARNDSIVKKKREPVSVPYKEHIPVHMFNIVFWPHTAPLEAVDTSTEQYDKHLDGFDVIQNSREALYCMLCDKKLRVVSCKTCQKGYCFECAFRIHQDPYRRKHDITIVEPRIVQVKEVSKSLIYHVEMAQRASYELGYLVKYLRSAAEAKRLAEEKRIAKEFELQEEQKRLAFLKAQQEDEDKHIAATKIALLYRCKKARVLVIQRRQQKKLEISLKSQAKMQVAFIPFQRLFRRYSTRKWISKWGIVYNSRRKKKKRLLPGQKPPSDVSEKDLRARINFEIGQRRILSRAALFQKLYDKYVSTTQLLETNIASWLVVEQRLKEKDESLGALMKGFNEEHQAEMIRMGLIKEETSEADYELMEKNLRRLMVRVETVRDRMASLSALRWWLIQHLRGNYRRLATVKARYEDTIARLEWISVESTIIDRVEFQMMERAKLLGPVKDAIKAVEWLKKYAGYTAKHQATLDTKQETVLQEEINRLEIDEMNTLEFDSLMEEFLQSTTAHTQYLAERCQLDQSALVGPGAKPGTNEAVEVSKRLLAIKKKQLVLEDNVLDTIKKGLQAKLNNEDERNMNFYGFPNDYPERTVDTFGEIEVVLLDKFEAHAHFDVEEFFRVFMAQPWLGEMAVEDVRVEEEINSNILGLGKATEELKGLTHTTKTTEEKIVNCNRKLVELEYELEIRQTSPDGDDELPEDREERENLLDLLTKEKLGNQAEISLLTGVLHNTANFAVTSRGRIAFYSDEIARLQGVLEERRQERQRLAAVFFDKEKANSQVIYEMVAKLQADVEKKLINTTHQLRYCQAAEASPEIIDRIIRGDMTLEERVAMAIPLKNFIFELQHHLAEAKPKLNAFPDKKASILLNNRSTILQTDCKYLEHLKSILSQEETVLHEFSNRRQGYENAIKMFQDDIIRLQRQKALQRDLDERKERLLFLRETRMRHQMEEKKAAEDLKLAAVVPKRPKINLQKELAKATKKAIRGIKDTIYKLQHQAATQMDVQERRMANRLKEKSKTGAGPVVALRRIHITCGIDEGNAFRTQNDFFKERGMPYFVQVEKGFGFQLYIWTQNTMKMQQFITHLVLGHKDPTHAKYKDLTKEGYEKSEHEKSPLVFWVKRDPMKSRSICDITFSFDSADDIRCFADGFERHNEEETLEDFGFPPSTLWVKKVDKLKHEERLNVDALVAEYANGLEMLAKNPADKTVQSLVEKVRDRLAVAREKEKVNDVTNPLTPAVDLMSLNSAELEQWLIIFRSFDTEKVGGIELTALFEKLEETPTAYNKSVFIGMDAIDPESGLIECGDFMRVFATYCFFGKQEVLRTLYNFADDKKKGEITHTQFVSLLNVLNPYDKIRAKRALTEMELKADKPMKFHEFEAINERFPALFYPAFRLQKSMRDKTMGENWWVDKLKTYRGVRKKLLAIDSNADQLAEMEMKRFLDDERKAKRMAERELEIQTETSAARKALLQARQFLDEFS